MARENPYGQIQELEHDCTRLEREVSNLQTQIDNLTEERDDALLTIEDLVKGGQGRSGAEVAHTAYVIGGLWIIVAIFVGMVLGAKLWN